jgi:hypothetical protein
MPDGFSWELTNPGETFSITLIGLQNALSRILTSDVTAVLDIARLMDDRNMEQMREGTYSVPMEINLGSSITIANTVTVLLDITAD